MIEVYVGRNSQSILIGKCIYIQFQFFNDCFDGGVRLPTNVGEIGLN